MTVDRKHTEIFDRPNQMYAEGTSICAKDIKPKELDILALLKTENYYAFNIEIWHDNLQKFWRWSCDIKQK